MGTKYDPEKAKEACRRAMAANRKAREEEPQRKALYFHEALAAGPTSWPAQPIIAQIVPDDPGWNRILAMIEGLTEQTKILNDKTLTEEQVCEAFHISIARLQEFRQAKEDPLPAMKIGDEFRYDLEEVRAWAKRKAEAQAIPHARRVRESRPEAKAKMTEAQVASYLHVGPDAVRRFRSRDRDPLPAEKAGRRWLYRVTDVDAWLKRQGDRARRPRPRPLRRPPAWVRRPAPRGGRAAGR